MHLGLFLMCTRCLALQDFFFRCYADAVAQAVLYAMFLAYPKSRIDFTEKFRKDPNQWRFLGTVKVQELRRFSCGGLLGEPFFFHLLS